MGIPNASNERITRLHHILCNVPPNQPRQVNSLLHPLRHNRWRPRLKLEPLPKRGEADQCVKSLISRTTYRVELFDPGWKELSLVASDRHPIPALMALTNERQDCQNWIGLILPRHYSSPRFGSGQAAESIKEACSYTASCTVSNVRSAD